MFNIARVIDFWFSVGSTYTYLTVMRIGALAKERGVEIRWRPFSVRALMVEQNNIPFRDKPIKTAYMWRDLERRAERHGFSARVPVPYPLTHWDEVNRVATLAAREGWCEPFVVGLYRRWFVDGEEPGLEPGLREELRRAGQDPARVIAEAAGTAVGAAYLRATDDARLLGIFGSPTFAVSGEIFWGDDRLEDALDWAVR